MDRQDFFDQIVTNHKIGFDLIKSKNTDYAATQDPFKNFRAAEMFGMTVEQGILLRMSDKMSRIANLLESEPKVKEESIEDALLDLMNYTNILLTYRQDKRSNSITQSVDDLKK